MRKILVKINTKKILLYVVIGIYLFLGVTLNVANSGQNDGATATVSNVCKPNGSTTITSCPKCQWCFNGTSGTTLCSGNPIGTCYCRTRPPYPPDYKPTCSTDAECPSSTCKLDGGCVCAPTPAPSPTPTPKPKPTPTPTPTPYLCMDSVPPLCGGSCTSPEKCLIIGGACECGIPCNKSSVPGCGGKCEDGQDPDCLAFGLGGCFCAKHCGNTAPTCNGSCPYNTGVGPTEKCFKTASGGCECKVSCSSTSPPTCGGGCADPTKTCINIAGKCDCQITCENSAPTCNGPCADPNKICDNCNCVLPCDKSDPNTCDGGGCPLGQSCFRNEATLACGCDVPCKINSAGDGCTGGCSPPLSCRPFKDLSGKIYKCDCIQL